MQGLRQAWLWSVRAVLVRWVRITIKPDDAVASIASRTARVCYVLERESVADRAVLDNACQVLGLPSPEKAHFELSRRSRLWRRRRAVRAPRYLEALTAAAAADASLAVDIVPVAIFWGRAPQKEMSPWRLLFAEDWVLVGRFRKLLSVIFNGRNTLLYFGEPLRLRDFLMDDAGTALGVRKILRTLRTGLRAQRASTIGPDLSHRRTLVAHILNTQAVRQAARQKMTRRPGTATGKPLTRRAALLIARRHALEIAANYSPAFVAFMSLALGRLWNWLYDGVEFEHVEKLREVADGAEIIYVPCHRSHMDYLLLSYAIYHKGFALPHIAAGVNLNMPVIGRFLRRGGAFFLRRSFKGDALYSAVFNQYLGFMMTHGHPLEYFIEGGRSRTGRLLSPRIGMLSMTVRSFMRVPQRPVVFVPVYFGYERIVEGRTYIGELSGRQKEKESVAGLLKAIGSVMRSQFGRVHVNLGEPISLDALLQRHHPTWRNPAPENEPPAGWMNDAILELANRILVEINSAAAVTPVNLVALAMLATPRTALAESVLAGQVDLYKDLLRAAPYSALVTATPLDAVEIIRYAERMDLLERHSHPLGDIMRMNEDNAVLATYYRNNVLHLFAMPSLIACAFISNQRMTTADLQRLVWRVYPYIAAELFLRWEESEISAVVLEILDAMVRLALLESNAERTEWRRPGPASLEAVKLSLLSEVTLQTLERYYLVVALLLQAGSGVIGQEALEQRCHLMAQRISVLYGLNSPEFFDKSLFRNFIDLLRRREVVEESADSTLIFGGPLVGVAADAQLVLSEQIRRSILQVTSG